MNSIKNERLERAEPSIDEDDEMDPKAELGSPSMVEAEPEMSPQQLDNYIDDIAETVRVGLDQSIAILTPWFFNNMPKIYYQTTPRQEKVRHLSAIITGHIFETKQTVELWDRDRTKVTYIGPGGDRKILLDMANKIRHHNMKMGAVYFSRDRLLFLSTFFCDGHSPLDRENNRITEKVSQAKLRIAAANADTPDDVRQYIEHMDNEFVMYATINRLTITYRMVQHMLHHEGSHTFLEPFENSSVARLTLGIKNVSPEEIIEPILHLINRHEFNVGRSFIVKFDEGYRESITVMHFVLTHASNEKITPDLVPMIRLIKALRTLSWVDNDEYSVFTREPYDFSINAANLIRSMATWCHIFLSKKIPYAYSMYRVRNAFFHNPEIARQIVDLFRLKFDPMNAKGRAEGQYQRDFESLENTVSGVNEDIDRGIFRECINFITHCIKTNYFHATKTGHAFRMAPEVLDPRHYKDMPYGFYFFSGRNFRAFQVRWKDIARGGMRVVMPRNIADYEYALSGLFDEVYGLSYAQQLKNKDIPEGGAKIVLVLKPDGHRDQAVKACVNALLDLLVEDEESHETSAQPVSYINKPEIIYVGPDENITNELIVWITEQANRRNYRYWSAFMSSKPGAGINHKEFGVTSEGINVYVENTLQFLGIDPRKTKFSVKLTGGPDGDVAGNELKILNREYGENARVVAIADGLGCAHDPEGLDWSELLRLVHGNFSIVNFNRSKLKGSGAYVLAADTNENIKKRNQIYFSVYADIFIPAGGRPYSVNSKNWKNFFPDEQNPTVKAIVEGANIFFTQDARKMLEDKGIIIIKDSSANKTGVICSSFEIIASLTVTAKEFADIKTIYVGEVLQILRNKADAEAKLLFREYTKSDGQRSLVELSLEISREINDLTDTLLEEFTRDVAATIESPLFREIIARHCPAILTKNFGQRIYERLPEAHQIAIIASFIASYVVYREGLGWLKTMPKAHWGTAMRIYMEKDKLAFDLQNEVLSSGVTNKEQIKTILSRSAARDLTILELQQKAILA